MASTTAQEISGALNALADADIANHSKRFFKTGKGEYGEGDKFLGIRVPVLRRQVTRYRSAPLSEVTTLLTSPWHEERLLALLLLVSQFDRGDEAQQAEIYNQYLAHTRYVNNWDLVDSSAPQIVGAYLAIRPRKILYTLAESTSLWERRIAIMATLHFIRNLDFDDTLNLATLLINDTEDLIHKAVGWMLREVGNRDPVAERDYLQLHYRHMPRTMLRYAIEKFPQEERLGYLHGTAQAR